MNQPTNREHPMYQAAEIVIQPATAEDMQLFLQLICELAEYAQMLKDLLATGERLRQMLVRQRSGAEVLLAYLDDELVGCAVFFSTCSTFLGQPGIILQDFYILPAARSRGIGRTLLARVAKIATERDCSRLEWSAYDWNDPAARFYVELGAEAKGNSTVHRLSGEPLCRLADWAY
jgi:GNAT superfamily N-acetyltransferase